MKIICIIENVDIRKLRVILGVIVHKHKDKWTDMGYKLNS